VIGSPIAESSFGKIKSTFIDNDPYKYEVSVKKALTHADELKAQMEEVRLRKLEEKRKNEEEDLRLEAKFKKDRDEMKAAEEREKEKLREKQKEELERSAKILEN
jgi:hypothetical protein